MKLLQLANIIVGTEIKPDKLMSKASVVANDYIYLDDAVLGQSEVRNEVKYVAEKTIKKDNLYAATLNYGDYLLYYKDDSFHLFRYSEINKRGLAGRGTLIIRPSFAYLSEYLGYDKNKRYFLRCLKNQVEKIEHLKKNLALLENVEIPTDNIRELEDANIAEQIGISAKVDNVQDINIVQKSIPMDKLMKRINYGELVIDSEFQRKPGLWTIDVKSRLIESMIVNIPIPAFYFDGNDTDKWHVVDGLQRLSATHAFINNGFRLTGLDYLPNLEDKTFAELDRVSQRNIEEFEVYAFILQRGTPPSVKYKIFKSINTSSLRLEPQEIRHAINPGVPAEFLKKIAESDWFKSAVVLSDARKDRMEDREVVLRYIAFKRTRYQDYRPSIVDFLNEAMSDIYNIYREQCQELEEELKNRVLAIQRILGDMPFSRSMLDKEKPALHNNVIFELLTYCFSKLTDPEIDRTRGLEPKLKSKIQQYFYDETSSEPRFWDYDYAYSKDGLFKRFSSVEGLVKDIKSILHDYRN